MLYTGLVALACQKANLDSLNTLLGLW